MNILYSVFTTGWGGLEKYPLTLFETMKKKGHNMYILTTKDSKLFKASTDMGIETFGTKTFEKIDFRVVREMKKILIRKNIDVVHINSSRELYNWRLALVGFPHVKVVITFHIGVPNHMEPVHRFLYRRVDKVIAISDFEMQEMYSKLPVPQSKITYVCNGVNLDKFTKPILPTPDEKKHLIHDFCEIRTKFNIPKEHLLFSSIGNLSKGKGILEWVDATIAICKTHENISFIWVGDDSHINEEYTMKDLQNKIDESGFKDRIILAGYQTQVEKFLEASDLFLLPARKESFGLVYIEAMAMGLPVIACNAGGAREIITNGIHGYLCEPDNVESLTQTIDHAIKNIDKLKKMEESNIAYSKKFSMENHVNRLLEIYTEKK